jgi:hypothetical protein
MGCRIWCTGAKGVTMLEIKKRYVVDEQNRRVAVQSDLETFARIEEVLEDFALARWQGFMKVAYRKRFLKDLASVPEPKEGFCWATSNGYKCRKLPDSKDSTALTREFAASCDIIGNVIALEA